MVFRGLHISKFGALLDSSGDLKRSAGATRMIERFCVRCDLIVIQEVQRNFSALDHLRDQLNAASGEYDYMISVT